MLKKSNTLMLQWDLQSRRPLDHKSSGSSETYAQAANTAAAPSQERSAHNIGKSQLSP
jgi:hypothetical protein